MAPSDPIGWLVRALQRWWEEERQAATAEGADEAADIADDPGMLSWFLMPPL